MGVNGNGLHSGNGVLSTKSVQDLLVEFETTGDQAPFEEIVRRYAGMVYNVCYGVSKDAHEAEDATQAVFLTLAVRSKTAQKIQYLGPWLQRVAQRLSLDMKRSKKRRGAREMKHHDINVSRWNDNAMPHDIGMDELRGILRDEIDKLPTKYRMPLILHYFGGLKPEEMSQELGIKANTLGVRLHRARKMLGDNLNKRGIVVGGTVLTAALAMLVPMYIQNTIASKAAATAAQYWAGHSLVTADVSANVMALVGSARRAAMMGKIKAVTAAVAIGVAAVAGAGEVVRQVRAGGIEFRRMIDLNRWFAPLFERLRSPVRLGDATSATDELLRGTPEPTIGTINLAALDWNRLPQPAITPTSREPEAIFAAPAGSTTDTHAVQRTPLAAPIEASRMLPRAPAVAVAAPPGLAPAALARTGRPTVGPAAPGVMSVGPIPSGISPAPSLDSRFASARGSFTQTTGALQRDQIILDDNAALQSFRLAGGTVRVQHLVVGDTGRGEFIHTAGTVSAEELSLGKGPEAVGAYELSGTGQLSAARQQVGVEGTANLTQSGGSNHGQDIALGVATGGLGAYTFRSGQIFTNDLRIGVDGTGVFTQSGGSLQVKPTHADGGIRIAERAGSHGTLTQSGGTIESDNVFVGVAGDGEYVVEDGRTVASKFVLGTSNTGDGTFRATDGVIVFNNAPGVSSIRTPASDTGARTPAAAWSNVATSSVRDSFIVGLNGSGELQLGNQSKSPEFREATATSSTNIVVRATASAEGTIRGWGESELRGVLEQNGRVIADGLGKPRALDFSRASGIHNSIENDADGSYGLYAQRGGELVLPPIHVSAAGQYNWGESARDPVPDLVNSVRVGFGRVDQPGEANISLLAPERAAGEASVPNGELLIGLWSFQRDGLSADASDLLIRYDEQMVEHIGLPETALSLITFADGRWQSLAADKLVLDTDRNLIGGQVTGDFSLFAVSLSTLGDFGSIYTPGLVSGSLDASSSRFIDQANLATLSTRGGGAVPEPGSLAVLAAAGTLLSRRRR